MHAAALRGAYAVCGALVEHGKVNRSLTAGVTIDRILRDYPHGVSCCHDSHALESCWRLACQVDLAAVDHHGETALHLAIRGGSVDWFGGRRILASMPNVCFLGDLYQPPLNCSLLYLLSVVDRLYGGSGSKSAGTRSSLMPWVPCCYADRTISSWTMSS